MAAAAPAAGASHRRKGIRNVRNAADRGRKHRQRPERRTSRRPGSAEVPGRQQFAAPRRRRHLGAGQLAVRHRQLLGSAGLRRGRVAGQGLAGDRGPGHVYTSEYEDRDGMRRSTLEMRATAVGPDLSRCIARVEKTVSVRIGDRGDRGRGATSRRRTVAESAARCGLPRVGVEPCGAAARRVAA